MSSNSTAYRRCRAAPFITVCCVTLMLTAASPAAAAGGPGRRDGQAQAHAASIVSTICGLASGAVGVGVSGLISLVTEGKVSGPLSGALVGGVTSTVCPGALGSLAHMFGLIAARKPSIRSRLGPVVFAPTLRFSPDNTGFVFATVSWLAVDPSAPIRYYALWERINNGRWFQLALPTRNTFTIAVPRLGQTLHFAVRAVDTSGNLSPWSFTS